MTNRRDRNTMLCVISYVIHNLTIVSTDLTRIFYVKDNRNKKNPPPNVEKETALKVVIHFHSPCL